ncbi:hypothetical protein [Herbidospora sp. NBRC 101105]|uniref:hypothetical protein n=1 Tax=Herbidospora sp. NBRC 101105 TaxID=3032195 RepID=UPI00249FB757|nr:hypothetical protein [Herbidospora sp. NBRC 101105]GLX96113.1 hypothetical protein Hesp01_40630 [Herbidospora sp. NBRC 101105]
MRRTLLSSAVLAFALTAAVPAYAEPAPPAPLKAAWKQDRVIDNPKINESSGLYASPLHPGVVWTHNDGAGPATLYAIGPDGSTVATVTIEGAAAVDTEAMGGFVDQRGNALIYLADTGDNDKTRQAGVTLFVLPEPKVLADTTVTAERYPIVYPDGPQDSEAVLVNPANGNLYFVSKTPTGGAVYGAPASLVPDVANRLERLVAVPHVISDGLIGYDGRMYLRGLNKIRIFTDVTGHVVQTIDAPKQPQGESMALSADGKTLLVGSEGEKSAVFAWALPKELVTGPIRKPGPQPDPNAIQQTARAKEPSRLPQFMLGGVAGLVVLIGAGAAIRRLRR